MEGPLEFQWLVTDPSNAKLSPMLAAQKARGKPGTLFSIISCIKELMEKLFGVTIAVFLPLFMNVFTNIFNT